MDKIKIEGLKELSDVMGQLPGAVAKRVLANAVRKAALIVQARAMALAPEAVADTVTGKSTHVRGTLKRSISIFASMLSMWCSRKASGVFGATGEPNSLVPW